VPVPNAFGARAFPGQVTRVAPVVDVPTRTLTLVFGGSVGILAACCSMGCDW
jgi:hypothetical protein